MSDDKTLSQNTLWLITAVAVIAAAAPHAFFAPPLMLHMQGQFDAWLGIATWSPAILAGVGLFFGAEFGDRLEGRTSMDPSMRGGALVIAVILAVVLTAALTIDRWSDMASMRPWDELKTALPMFAGLGVLRAIFFQGFVQHRVLGATNTTARVGILLALEAAIALPFLVSTGPAVAVIIPLVLIEAMLGAVTCELGFTTRVALLTRAVAAGSFIWFQQSYLL